MTKLSGIGAPLLCTNELESQGSETEFDLYGVDIPTCPLQHSFKATLYFSTGRHEKNCIGNGIAALVVEGTDHRLRENNFPNTMDIIVKFVDISFLLPKAFKLKCSELLSAGKK